ncbi:unnamed protein product [Owenia fusiformis]|uniref:Galactosylgalactosylxylosylprotein 3-beta-glucuronosyltransferase n=1 Tax=Owenia fusiformis TaxID=6347 RepID=A0A8J1XWH5_OWEFU|nr:unnamed protein product [Owenia fusiformis]
MGYLTPRRLLVFYFMALFMSLIYVIYSFASWCPNSFKEMNMRFPNDGDVNELQIRDKMIYEKNELLKLLQSRFQKVETNLRRLYPEVASEILEKDSNPNDLPYIYAITPTYTRPVQKAELIRLSQTFLHVRNFHWIVVEDSDRKTKLVENLLEHSGLEFTHLNVKTPDAWKLAPKDPNWLKPRGVLQRNLGLTWIRENLKKGANKGVLYFADDDNTYDLQIFEEMRGTKKVSVWPVGLVGKLRYESPIVVNGKVTGWHTYWMPERDFALDMAGFAINIELLFDKPLVQFEYEVKRGYQETTLLRGFVTKEELEPLADNCRKVLVWHTRTEKADLRNEEKLKKYGKPPSDLTIEV